MEAADLQYRKGSTGQRAGAEQMQGMWVGASRQAAMPRAGQLRKQWRIPVAPAGQAAETGAAPGGQLKLTSAPAKGMPQSPILSTPGMLCASCCHVAATSKEVAEGWSGGCWWDALQHCQGCPSAALAWSIHPAVLQRLPATSEHTPGTLQPNPCALPHSLPHSLTAVVPGPVPRICPHPCVRGAAQHKGAPA